MKTFQLLGLLLLINTIVGQRASISYELNGRPSHREIQDSTARSPNPFVKFMGEWTLRNDTWIHNWGATTDTIEIPQHHTVSSQVNTDNSLLSIVDGPEPNGHLFWSYNPKTKGIGYLSSFGTLRAGQGNGVFFGDQNIRFKVSFADEAPGTYRIYTYEWINADEYALHSRQFDADDQPTGLFYQGNFVRVKPSDDLEQEIRGILSVLDNNDIPKEEQIMVYAEDVIHMAPNHPVIDRKADLLAYLKEQQQYGRSAMQHRILSYEEYDDIVIMQGEVIGNFYPADGGAKVPFRTKNLFVFSRQAGKLKISKVIYNLSP